MKKATQKIPKPVFDKNGYQINMTDLNGEPLPSPNARTLTRGELDAMGFPRPEEFARMFKNERVNLQLSARALAFFKRAAKKERVPYQRLIRAAVDYYVDHADQLQAA